MLQVLARMALEGRHGANWHLIPSTTTHPAGESSEVICHGGTLSAFHEATPNSFETASGAPPTLTRSAVEIDLSSPSGRAAVPSATIQSSIPLPDDVAEATYHRSAESAQATHPPPIADVQTELRKRPVAGTGGSKAKRRAYGTRWLTCPVCKPAGSEDATSDSNNEHADAEGSKGDIPSTDRSFHSILYRHILFCLIYLFAFSPTNFNFEPVDQIPLFSCRQNQ